MLVIAKFYVARDKLIIIVYGEIKMVKGKLTVSYLYALKTLSF